MIILFFLFLLFWTVDTFVFMLLAYDIVGRKRLTKSEHKRMRKKEN